MWRVHGGAWKLCSNLCVLPVKPGEELQQCESTTGLVWPWPSHVRETLSTARQPERF